MFAILAITYLLGSISFLVFGTGELQIWNDPDKMLEENQESGIPLKEMEGKNSDNN